METKKPYKILNVANTDKIGFIGDSYTESHFSVEGKAYICKLSLFSDYNYENFAKSGDTYRGNLDRMRKHIPIYHDSLSWTDIKPKYHKENSTQVYVLSLTRFWLSLVLHFCQCH